MLAMIWLSLVVLARARTHETPVTHWTYWLLKPFTALLQSYLSGPHLTICIINFPASRLFHLSSLLYFHDLTLTFYCSDWKLTHNFLTALFKGHSLLSVLFSVLPAPFPPLPFGRPLIQHAQSCIPQTVGAPSNAAHALQTTTRSSTQGNWAPTSAATRTQH